jgi:hypothetical protein
MTKETKQGLLEAALECLLESETLFIYVTLPLLCVAVVYVVGTSLFHLVFDPNAANIASAMDGLSIDPANWFPRS